jgi:hypothetical protein
MLNFVHSATGILLSPGRIPFHLRIRQAIASPEAFAIAFLPGAKTGRIAFPELNLPDNIGFGATDPGIHIPPLGDFSNLIHFHAPVSFPKWSCVSAKGFV